MTYTDSALTFDPANVVSDKKTQQHKEPVELRRGVCDLQVF